LRSFRSRLSHNPCEIWFVSHDTRVFSLVVIRPHQDLVFIEEAFERLLLDYDRVFSAMGIPACLWRRTGEIYKANREFTELVGIDGIMLRDVSVLPACIYQCVELVGVRDDFVFTSSWRKNQL
jgi:hypothetical protein